jgi:hypothetical protein
MKKSGNTALHRGSTALATVQKLLARQKQRLSRNLLDLEAAVRQDRFEFLDAGESH